MILLVCECANLSDEEKEDVAVILDMDVFVFPPVSPSGHLAGSLHSVCAAGAGLRPPGGHNIRHTDSHLQNTEVRFQLVDVCLFLLQSHQYFYFSHLLTAQLLVKAI